MNEVEIGRYIGATFGGVDVVTVEGGDSFFFYSPDDSVPPDHRFPIITLVTGDRYDQFSDLDRPGVFRLNIGLAKETFRARFGKPQLPGATGVEGAGEGEGADGSRCWPRLMRWR